MSFSDQRSIFPTLKIIYGSEEFPNNNNNNNHTEPAASASAAAGKKVTSRGKTAKKIPKRGMGVEQLERLRFHEETLKQLTEVSQMIGPPPPLILHHDHHQYRSSHLVPPPPPRYGASLYGYAAPSPPNHAYGLLHQYHPHHQPQPQPLIYGGGGGGGSSNGFGHVLGTHQGPNLSGGGGVASNAGWFNHQVNRVDPFGSGSSSSLQGVPTILDTSSSKELTSIQNFLHHSAARSDQPFGYGFKSQANAFNENGRGSNVWRQRPNSEQWNNVSDYYHDESAEVIAVHRNGKSEVFMEYEFFPGKDGRGTVPKELEFPKIIGGSAGGGGSLGGGEAASSITTVVADYGDTASNSIDLSLKLYN